ncbi:MAG: hypothetical protein EAX96_05400 [Candidatus Lokiarchaeota archaeon]|nr:hypothetical protein [Candidatus Lokiarchaeota archaeon]
MNKIEIWNQPELVINRIKNWIKRQRWAGLQNIENFDILIDDWLIFENNNKYKIIGYFFIINKIEESKKIQISRIFLPFLFYFDKKLIEFEPDIVIKNELEQLFLIQAEYSSHYLSLIIKNMEENLIIVTNKKKEISFSSKDPTIKSLLNEFRIKDFNKGQTTNFLLKLLSNKEEFILKCYRKMAYNPEPIFLIDLFKNGFENIINPIAVCEYRDNYNIPLYLISDFINFKSDLGLKYWNNLNDYLQNGVFQKTKKDLIKLNESLVDLIIRFHYNSFDLDNKNKKLENFSKNDSLFFNNAIKKIFNYLISTNSIKAMKYNNLLIEKISQIENLFNNLPLFIDWYKIRVHQDLHLGQILIEKESNKLIITDFEGDPNRPESEKDKKDLIFRDLASVITAFFYIKQNLIKKNFENVKILDLYLESTKIKDEILINFLEKSKIWIQTVINDFIKSYYEKLDIIFKDELKNKNFDNFKTGILIYTYERIIREIYYEIKFRTENLEIPLSILFILNEISF